MQCMIIQHMIQVVTAGRIMGPLSQQQQQGMDNMGFVQQYLLGLLSNFPNLNRCVCLKGLVQPWSIKNWNPPKSTPQDHDHVTV